MNRTLPTAHTVYEPKTFPYTDGFTLLPSLIQPKSRGFVALNSSNAAEKPVIQPNYLKEDADKAFLIKSLKIAKSIIATQALGNYTDGISFPQHSDSDDLIFTHIKKTMECIYHPVGTCRMGTDPDSVVDPQLRVHGIAGLRVADASVMPRIVSGNTNAACIMIGERAADFILKS